MGKDRAQARFRVVWKGVPQNPSRGCDDMVERPEIQDDMTLAGGIPKGEGHKFKSDERHPNRGNWTQNPPIAFTERKDQIHPGATAFVGPIRL